MDKPFAFASAGFAPTYRSGVAARLAGLSVETLRVWERRYGVSDTQRSPHGQRLYSADQVRKLSLLKQMVDQGHPIGTLINLSVEQLEEMSSASAGGAHAPGHPIRLALVGNNLARRIANARREGLALEVMRACAGLDEAAPALQDCGADVLLVELSELGDAAVPLILAARANAGVASVVVLYRYCASATIRELRAHDCLVARVPAEMGELVLLCRAALAGRQLALPERPDRTLARRFDDDALAAIAAIGAGGTRVACECPRHLAELLITVASFERYSAQCASHSPADAELHRELEHAAAQARVLLEHAMERLARAEGLVLPAARASVA